MRERIEDKSIFDYLAKEMKGDIDLTVFPPEAQTEISRRLADAAGGVHDRERRKFGVENRGLCYLIALAAELIQSGQREGSLT